MAQAGPLPSKNSLNLTELRSRVMIGQLPDDFLRISMPDIDPNNSETVATQGGQNVVVPIPQQTPFQSFGSADNFYSFVPPHTRGRLSIKIVEAKLTKNYGLPGIRMDPYIRLRIGIIIFIFFKVVIAGHTLFETPTCVNGGKTPHWNRTVNSYLPEGVESIYLQIYDERAFTNDELVAWAHLILPQGIFNREVIDEWYQLSGPQGEGKEGVINLVVSFSPVPRPQQNQEGGESREIINAPLFTEEELNELAEMFPSIEREVIKQVLEAKGGVKEAAVTALLDISG